MIVRRFTVFLFTFLLMMNFVLPFAWADEEQTSEATPESETSTEVVAENTNTEEKKEVKTKAKAKIVEIKDQKEDSKNFQEVKLEILNGEYDTREFTTKYYLKDNGYSSKLKKDDVVYVEITKGIDDNIQVCINNVVRLKFVLIFLILAIVSIIILYRELSIRIIIAILSTCVCMYFVIKGFKTEVNPILITCGFLIFSSFLITFIQGGIGKRSLSIFLTTVVESIIISFISVILSKISRLSGGFEIENASCEINYSFLIFIGTLIIAEGICNHISFVISYKLDETKSKTEDVKLKKMVLDGISIGKNYCYSIINGLVFLLFGLTISTILIAYLNEITLHEIFNYDLFIKNEIFIVSMIIGVIISIPISSAGYALINRNKTVYKTTSENKVDGNRSLKI